MRKRSAVQAEFGLRNFAIKIAGSCSWKRLERNGTKLVKSKGRRAYRVVEGSIRSSCACPLANWESVMRGGNTNLQSGQANDANKNTGINSQSSCPDVSQDREPSGLPRVGPRVGPDVVPPSSFMPAGALDALLQGGFRGRADRI